MQRWGGVIHVADFRKEVMSKKSKIEWINTVRLMKKRSYWNKPNTIEFIAFFIKVCILFPGLLFDKQWWWLYIFALGTSTALVWTSTKKTLPTIILLNIAWIVLASFAIIKHFAGW